MSLSRAMNRLFEFVKECKNAWMQKDSKGIARGKAHRHC